MVEIARVARGINNMETAKALHKVLGHNCALSETIKMMRSYERDGLLVKTETEVIMYHIY